MRTWQVYGDMVSLQEDFFLIFYSLLNFRFSYNNYLDYHDHDMQQPNTNMPTNHQPTQCVNDSNSSSSSGLRCNMSWAAGMFYFFIITLMFTTMMGQQMAQGTNTGHTHTVQWGTPKRNQEMLLTTSFGHRSVVLLFSCSFFYGSFILGKAAMSSPWLPLHQQQECTARGWAQGWMMRDAKTPDSHTQYHPHCLR